MYQHKLSLLLPLLFTTLISSTLAAVCCNPDDKAVLLKIKKILNNPYILTSWNPENDCCHWYCVKCDRTTNRINVLNILAGDLPGQIPSEVAELPYLETLIFHKLTNLTGPIPDSISKLKHLKFLDLSWNNLTGSVPESLSKLSNLTFFDLSFNSLSGSIPSSLSKLQNLAALHLDRNKLTGKIPESFGEFKCTDLYLSHNQLSGKVPASLGKLQYDVIDLSRNKLEGDPSFLFGSNKRGYRVDLSRNMFEFNLSKVEFSQSLTNLDLNHKKLYGSIPEDMTKLSLQFFNVSYNRLCGQIPVGGQLQSFDSTTYFHNRCLCGAPLQSCK